MEAPIIDPQAPSSPPTDSNPTPDPSTSISNATAPAPAAQEPAAQEEGVEVPLPLPSTSTLPSPLEPGQIAEPPTPAPPPAIVTSASLPTDLAAVPTDVLGRVKKMKEEILSGVRDSQGRRIRDGELDGDGDTVMTVGGGGDDAQSLLDSMTGILGDSSVLRPVGASDTVVGREREPDQASLKREREREEGRRWEDERAKRAKGEGEGRGGDYRRGSGRRTPPRDSRRSPDRSRDRDRERDYYYNRRSRSRSADRYVPGSGANGNGASSTRGKLAPPSGGERPPYRGNPIERSPGKTTDPAPAGSNGGPAMERRNSNSNANGQLGPQDLGDRTQPAEGYQSLPRKVVDRYVPGDDSAAAATATGAPAASATGERASAPVAINPPTDSRPMYGPGSIGGPPPSVFPTSSAASSREIELRDRDRRLSTSNSNNQGRPSPPSSVYRRIERSPAVPAGSQSDYRGRPGEGGSYPGRSSPPDYRGPPPLPPPSSQVDAYRPDPRDRDPRAPSSYSKPPGGSYPDSRYGPPPASRDYPPSSRDYGGPPPPPPSSSYGSRPPPSHDGPGSGYSLQQDRDRYRPDPRDSRDYRGPPPPSSMPSGGPQDDRYYGGRPPVPESAGWAGRSYDSRGPPPAVDRYGRPYDNGPPAGYNSGPPPPPMIQESEIAELKARVLEMERLAAAQKARDFDLRDRDRAAPPPSRGGSGYYSGPPPPPPVDNRGYGGGGRRDEPAPYRASQSHDNNYRPGPSSSISAPPPPPSSSNSYTNSIQARNAIVKDPATLRARDDGYRVGGNSPAGQQGDRPPPPPAASSSSQRTGGYGGRGGVRKNPNITRVGESRR